MSCSCIPSTFSPLLAGAEILNLEATWVTNFNFSVPSLLRYVQPGVEVVNATFCNVTVTYTHTGTDDVVNVETWLPPPQSWNERFQGVGGGGWVAGRFYLSYAAMAGALSEGYATVTTDAGLGPDPADWALTNRGEVNLNLLHNLGSISLGDEVCNDWCR